MVAEQATRPTVAEASRSVGGGVATSTHDRLVPSDVVVFVVAVAFAVFACGASPLVGEAVTPPPTVAPNANLLASCLASPAATLPVSSVTVRVAETTAWGFWLVGEARGFSPGEPLLAWVFDPSWSTPSCLAAGKATRTGAARAGAAFWYRASAPGRYALCLVGVRSGRTACGMLRVTPRMLTAHLRAVGGLQGIAGFSIDTGNRSPGASTRA
jgi:hypothetical protein